MGDSPTARLLPGGRRLHLNHGPIDLIIEASGTDDEVRDSYRQARARFQTILSELASELNGLRKPVAEPGWQPEGAVAGRMMTAVWPHRSSWITPMAAVAGAVADEILAAMTAGRTLSRAYVNNSGDIACFLGPGESFRLGLVDVLDRPEIDDVAVLTGKHGVGGVASSGWRGRSHSLGIADSVTVLAASAAAADAAATLIANAVNVDHPAVERIQASKLDDNSDLGEQLVTVSVGSLDTVSVESALMSGSALADRIAERGLIAGASLSLCGVVRLQGIAQVLLQDRKGERA